MLVVAIVEAHRLLKNSSAGKSYALITDTDVEVANDSNKQVDKMGKLWEIFNGVDRAILISLSLSNV